MFIIKYSFLADIKALSSTLRYIYWLNKNNYIYHLSPFQLPHKLSLNEFTNETLQSLPSHIHHLTNQPIIVYLVHFGTYGSYSYPNSIILSLHQTPKKAAQTLVHELAHLMVEMEVREKKLSHDDKERLANIQESKLMQDEL